MQAAISKRRVYLDLWNTGLPIFAELFLVSLFQMVDTALLKPCGTVSIAAVGLTAEPVNLLEFAFFALQTAIIARTAGLYVKRDWPAVHRLLAAVLKLISGAALVLGVAFAVCAEPILRLFGADAQTLPIAAAYLRVTLIAFLFRRVYSGVASVLKGIGAPSWARSARPPQPSSAARSDSCSRSSCARAASARRRPRCPPPSGARPRGKPSAASAGRPRRWSGKR